MKFSAIRAAPLAFFREICYTVVMKKNQTICPSETPEVIAPELPKKEMPVRTEQQPSSRPVTRYKFRFSILILCVLGAGLALCLAAIGLTTWQLADFLQAGSPGSAAQWLKFALLYLVSGSLAVIIIALLIRSEYLLTGKELVLAFGFIRMRYPLESILSVHLFKGAGKLAVYFSDEKNKYMAIVIRESLYETFVKDLLSRSERIAFSFSTAEEEEEFKKKK